MGIMSAKAPPFAPIKIRGHARAASDPVPSTGTSTKSFFSSNTSDDGTEDPIDSVIASSDCECSNIGSPSSIPIEAAIPTGLDLEHPIKAHALSPATGLRAIGLQAVAYGMPNMKVSHEKLRAAQYVFPPEMCLFVGNLPAMWDDGMLTRAVKYEFGQFGPCTVGVFRKVPTKPYAIVQYTDIFDASHAMYYGNGMWMERPLRVELSARARF